MKITIKHFALCLLLITSPLTHATDKTMSDAVTPYGTLLSDPNGLVTVEMAIFEEKNSDGLHDVLLRLTGFLAYQAGIDGQTLKYRAEPSGTGVDFIITENGADKRRITSRNTWGNWQSLQLNLGNNSYQLGVVDTGNAVQPLHLRSAWLEGPKKAEPSVVNPYGLLFYGEGLEVEVAFYNEKNADGLYDAILKFTGPAAHEAGIDGVAKRYSTVPTGTGYNFQIEEDGVTRNRLQSRNGWGNWSYYDVYFGNKNIPVSISPSNNVNPLHLLNEIKTP